MNKKEGKQAGFTLVELAVVMIVVGILIGGVLKGQELITSSRITKTASTIQGIETASLTFLGTYSAMAGDFTSPGTKLPHCNTAPCNVPGDGNGRVDTDTPDAAMTPGGENTNFWLHLAKADVLAGIDPMLGDIWTGNFPASPLGGGFHIGYDASNSLGAAAQSGSGHFLVIHNNTGGVPDDAIFANHAARLDRKMDDGGPTTGSIFATSTNCNNADTPPAYDEASNSARCGLYVRIQQ